MATRTISNAGGNWNSTSTWVEGAVPTAADEVVATSTSGNLTIPSATSGLCRSINLTNYTGTLTITGNLLVGDATPGTGNIAVKFVPGMGLVGGAGVFNPVSTSTTQQTLDFGGKTLGNNMTIGTGSSQNSYLLVSDLISNNTFSVFVGVFDSGNHSITCSSLGFSGATQRTINLGTSTVTCGNFLNTSSSSLSVYNFSNSNIILTTSGGIGSRLRTLGSGISFGKITVNCDNHTLFIASSGCSINELILNNAGGTTGTKFTAGQTFPVNTLTTNGSAGNLNKLISTSSGSQWSISKSSGTISTDYVSLQDSNATGGATFYAGANSTNVSGNTGWNFTAPPSGSVGMVILNRRFKSANRARRM